MATRCCHDATTADGNQGLSRPQDKVWQQLIACRRTGLSLASIAKSLRANSKGYRKRVMAAEHILGISAFYHDSAACLLRDGEIVAAAQEERFTRKKGDSSFPTHAIEYCLRTAGSRRRGSRVRRLLRQAAAQVRADPRDLSRGRAARVSVRSSRPAPSGSRRSSSWTGTLRQELGGYEGQVLYAEHHESHAASAFFPSPFEEAAILTMDGVGEWATAAIGVGTGKRDRDSAGAALARFARPAVLRVHLLHRLQGQLRRVQGHGAGAVRRAEVRGPDPTST